MKVLVTGASGYFGGRLCHALVRQGYSVRAFVRSTSDLSSLPTESPGGHHTGSFELSYGDVTDYSSLLAACSGCYVIFHSAAVVEPWLPDASRFISVNVGGLQNVLQACRETKTIEKIIYTSSFFALGPTDGYIADESQVHPELFFCTEYEKSKFAADKVALLAVSEGVPIVPVYPGVIYGPGKVTTGNIVAKLLIERFNGRLPGYIGPGNDKYSFSHVDDVVEGHIAAMKKGRLGERYLLTGENASFRHVFDVAAILTSTSRPRFNIPLWLVEACGWVSILLSRITGNLPLISPPTVYVMRHQWAYSCEKARKELGYKPRSLKEGLAELTKFTISLVFSYPHAAVYSSYVGVNNVLQRRSSNSSLASQSKKGEDFTLLKTECQRIVGEGVTTYSVFGLFDGHNGTAAAVYTKENLLNNILSAIPSDLNRDEWIAALPRALVAGFVKTDKDFLEKGQASGTTVTFVIIEGWVVTVASVGDSRCILESAEGDIYCLSADHRLECDVEDGGEVGRLNTGAGTEIGPMRCWPGGLCLSRSIGDRDVGEFIVPVPFVKQVKLSTAGGRLIISSDGVWDALSFESALNCSRGMSAEAAAARVVKEAILAKGLRDDTTCIVVNILPPEKIPLHLPPTKKQGKGVFKAMFQKKFPESSSQAEKEYIELDMVEEMFEEGSAMLSQRLDTKYPLSNVFKLFICAVCQVEIKPGEGISIHTVSSNRKTHPWDGPFLCPSCQQKKEAMEGKRPSRDRYSSQK
ncbi:hypothetical protein Nepgr_015645 [Nepenthes gracilis]|uniref:protein-serine/threonine phosphatase n=1 Tax=Nepenthes gracilis TaxID=150966 RepID=A0AAD3SN59_NEPGR|nr:hypothetical protein Nepgr_015645 [Nepenthes gracilis]